jgi:hypothetical protein
MFFAKNFELGLPFFLNALNADVNQLWRSCDFSNIRNLANDGYEVFEQFQRSQQSRYCNSAERFRSKIQRGLLCSSYGCLLRGLFGVFG